MMTSLVLAAAMTTGTVCNSHVVVRRNHHVIAPARVKVVQPAPVILFSVGANIRLEESIRRIIRQELQQGRQTSPDVQGQQQGSIATFCGKCHQGDASKGGVSLSGRLPSASVVKAIRAISDGSMPPNRQLTREQRNALLGELLEASTDDEVPSPTPADPGTAPGM